MKRLEGALNFATAEHWFARVDELAADDSLDLAAVTQCDSAGVALLLELARRAQRAGRSLSLMHVPAPMREQLRFFGVDKMLQLA